MDFMGIKEGSLLYRKQITFLSSHDRSTLFVQQRIINQLRRNKNVWHTAESESSLKFRICLTDVTDTKLAPNTFQPSKDTFRNGPTLYLSYKLFDFMIWSWQPGWRIYIEFAFFISPLKSTIKNKIKILPKSKQPLSSYIPTKHKWIEWIELLIIPCTEVRQSDTWSGSGAIV